MGEKESEKRSFDEALRRMLNTPPDHKARTKTGVPVKDKKPDKHRTKRS